MSDLERFEEMAERFRKETGYMHPGKDVGAHGYDPGHDVRAAVCGVWERMNARTEAMATQNRKMAAALRSLIDMPSPHSSCWLEGCNCLACQFARFQEQAKAALAPTDPARGEP